MLHSLCVQVANWESIFQILAQVNNKVLAFYNLVKAHELRIRLNIASIMSIINTIGFYINLVPSSLKSLVIFLWVLIQVIYRRFQVAYSWPDETAVICCWKVPKEKLLACFWFGFDWVLCQFPLDVVFFFGLAYDANFPKLTLDLFRNAFNRVYIHVFPQFVPFMTFHKFMPFDPTSSGVRGEAIVISACQLDPVDVQDDGVNFIILYIKDILIMDVRNIDEY